MTTDTKQAEQAKVAATTEAAGVVGKNGWLWTKKWAYTTMANGDVGIVVEGEKGYYPTGWNWGADYTVAREVCKERNARLGLTEKEAMRLVGQSF